jgi:hypothetical protein
MERALSTLARRETTTTSSHRLRELAAEEEEELTQSQQDILLRLPPYRWLRSDASAVLLRQGVAALADEYAQLSVLGVNGWLAQLRSGLSLQRTAISLAQGQALAALVECPTLSGHGLAAALEVGLLRTPAMARAAPLLARARLVAVAAPPTGAASASREPFFGRSSAGLSGFEFRIDTPGTAPPQQQRRKPSQQQQSQPQQQQQQRPQQQQQQQRKAGGF